MAIVLQLLQKVDFQGVDFEVSVKIDQPLVVHIDLIKLHQLQYYIDLPQSFLISSQSFQNTKFTHPVQYHQTVYLKHILSMQQQKHSTAERIYIVCLNPHCLHNRERCLSTKNLHQHPKECVQFFYPADQITQKHWTELEKYPIDNLGAAAKKKFQIQKDKNYFVVAIQKLRQKIQASLKQLQRRIFDIYPDKEFVKCYTSVYNLQKVAESLQQRKDPLYISSLINSNFSAQNYHVLLRVNESYDDLKITIDSLNNKLLSQFDSILSKHKANQIIPKNKQKVMNKKINYGVFKSKFIASSKIQFEKAVVLFPKIPNIASFLPWIYTDKYFNDGIHEFKISSLKYPMVQNTGFTVLEEHDIDTYPYTYFKSLFNRQGKGFKLISGEEIDQFISQTTVVTLKIELGPSPKASIYDSQMNSYYQCQLKEKTTYRMGVYGCGWSMEVIELN